MNHPARVAGPEAGQTLPPPVLPSPQAGLWSPEAWAADVGGYRSAKTAVADDSGPPGRKAKCT